MVFNNQTVRMHPRISIGGDTVRVRVSNAYGRGKLTIGAAYVGIRDQGPAIVPGSARQLSFGGSDTTTVAAGALVLSDAVQLDVPPLADLAVSLYLPGMIPLDFQSTGRYARQTNYISPPGDFTREAVMPVGNLTDQWYFLSGLSRAPRAPTRPGVHAAAGQRNYSVRRPCLQKFTVKSSAGVPSRLLRHPRFCRTRSGCTDNP